MRIPLDWLREHVDVGDPGALAERLTCAGIETTREAGRVPPPGVVAARILSCERHPNADRLTVCRVDTGAGEPATVVCGAPNVAAGRIGALAPPGARLGDLLVEVRKVRGVESAGMLCSERELGLSEDHSGILFLPEGTALGRPVAEVLATSEVLSCEVTSNRGDCMSVLGIAREVAAIESVPFAPRIPPPSTAPDGPWRIAVEDPFECPRYAARVVEGLRPGPSPDWMQRRLEAAGIRPLLDIVDVTNYVLLERGHPLHAFDADRLAGTAIVVRRARAGERLVTLDGKERSLDDRVLVIADSSGPVALAGIMGGDPTAVSAATTRILLEGACFAAARVRAGSRHLGLTTDASARFERTVDPEGVAEALDRAVELLCALHPSARSTGAPDVYPSRRTHPPLRLRRATLARLLGVELPAAEVRAILERLGLVVEEAPDGWAALAPPWRPDLAIEADLVEEVARIHGYDRIPDRTRGHAVSAGSEAPRIASQRRARGILLGLGLTEVVTAGLTQSGRERRLGASAGSAGPVVVKNPISADHDTLRGMLVPSLVEVLATNHARSEPNLATFEVARTYASAGTDAVEERLHAAILLSGTALAAAHSLEVKSCDFFDIKGLVEVYVEEFWGASPELAGGAPAILAPDASAVLRADGREVGWLGELGREARQVWDLPPDLPVFVAEFDLEVPTRGHAVAAFRPLPRHPGASRDVALVVPRAVRHADVVNSIRAAALELLESVRLFDVYEGPPLPAGERSLAFTMTFRAPDRSLTSEEVDARIHAIVERAARDHGARLR